MERTAMKFVAALVALVSVASTANAEVTAVVNDGTLVIETDRTIVDPDLGFFSELIQIWSIVENDQPKITVRAGFVTLITVPEKDLSKIVVDADHADVIFGGLNLQGMEFEGDVEVDVHTFGTCTLNYAHIKGDMTVRASGGRVVFSYFGEFFDPVQVDGNLTLLGGPGDDFFHPAFGAGTSSDRPILYVGRDLTLLGGPGNEEFGLALLAVAGETFVDLGQSNNAEPSLLFDQDDCFIQSSDFAGSVVLLGNQGADCCDVGNVTNFAAALLIDMGNGDDKVSLAEFATAPSLLFVDGGNGNGDTLESEFPLFAEEYDGFESVTSP